MSCETALAFGIIVGILLGIALVIIFLAVS